MPNETRIRELLAEILDSNRTPEEVCAGETMLLMEVRKKWRLLKRVGSEIDELFPCGVGFGGSAADFPADERDLLFSGIAFQMGFVTRDDLSAALHARKFARDRTPGRLLVDRRP